MEIKELFKDKDFKEWFCYFAERHLDEFDYEPIGDFQEPLIGLIKSKTGKSDLMPLSMIGVDGKSFGIRFIDLQSGKRWILYTNYKRLIIKQL